MDSDATLIFTCGPLSGGTKRTVDFAVKHEKSHHVSQIQETPEGRAGQVDHICRWLRGEIEEEEWPPVLGESIVLDVAGPRESGAKGIQEMVGVIIVKVFEVF